MLVKIEVEILININSKQELIKSQVTIMNLENMKKNEVYLIYLGGDLPYQSF